ncbi:MAG: hypothetical protein AAF598_01165 [Bacteroidota bacterium]
MHRQPIFPFILLLYCLISACQNPATFSQSVEVYDYVVKMDIPSRLDTSTKWKQISDYGCDDRFILRFQDKKLEICQRRGTFTTCWPKLVDQISIDSKIYPECAVIDFEYSIASVDSINRWHSAKFEEAYQGERKHQMLSPKLIEAHNHKISVYRRTEPFFHEGDIKTVKALLAIDSMEFEILFENSDGRNHRFFEEAEEVLLSIEISKKADAQ